jgi:hypothetical protein
LTQPNFLITGAPKCATTSVYYYLRQHPEIFMPENKEPRTFASLNRVPDYQGPGDLHREEHTVTDLAQYEALFDEARDEAAIGEASVIDLYDPVAADEIMRHLPRARLIALLRNPVDRAHSNYQHQRYHGREPLADFGQALEQEAGRLRSGWGPFWAYAGLGFYASQLQRYYERFEPDQIGVFLYDDLERDPVGLLQSIYRFLGVSDSFVPDVSRRYLVGGKPRVASFSKLIYSASRFKDAVRPLVPDYVLAKLKELEARANRRRQTLDPKLRASLIERFRDDLLQLEKILDRDLSAWLRG